MEMLSPSAIAVYCFTSAIICTAVAMIELLNRYSHAANWKSIVLNGPASAFLTVNFIVGILTFLAVQTSQTLEFNLEDGLTILGFLKSVLVGGGAVTFLRSSFIKIKGDDGDESIGPVAILDKFNAMLDKRIDLNQKMSIDRKIVEIMKDVDPFKARHILPAMCLTGLSSYKEQDISDMKAAIGDLFNDEMAPIRSILIGHALYKFCGIEVLESSVKVLGNHINIERSDRDGDIESQDANTISAELLKHLVRLRG